MSSMIGNNLRVSLFGQSHSPAIGVVLDGLPAGEKIDFAKLQTFLTRRAPGKNAYSTQRKEEDTFEILSGLVGDTTCGAPLSAIIRNTDTRSQDYEILRNIPRPSHADYAAFMKYGASHDIRGGGHFSGRLTAALCIAGGICIQALSRRGVEIAAHILSIGTADDRPFDPVSTDAEFLRALAKKDFPVLDGEAGKKMLSQIEKAKAEEDSLGGVVECCAVGVPPGVGQPLFEGLENRLAQGIFGIPAVKGVEFGAGFAAARMRGSENNDSFYYTPAGSVATQTNHHGGCLGGLSSGMPILLRAAFKPTPSIGKEQVSVNLCEKKNTPLVITGRHDPCIVPRAVPCVEAVVATGILDLMLARNGEFEF